MQSAGLGQARDLCWPYYSNKVKFVPAEVRTSCVGECLLLEMQVCVCAFCVCLYVCVWLRGYVCACMYAWVHVCMCVFVWVCIKVFVVMCICLLCIHWLSDIQHWSHARIWESVSEVRDNNALASSNCRRGTEPIMTPCMSVGGCPASSPTDTWFIKLSKQWWQHSH